MKTAFKIFLILAVAAALVVSFSGIFKHDAEDMICTGMELEVEDSLSLGLIDKDEVLDIMKKEKISFEGKKISDINIGQIEQRISESEYIDTVTCAISASGKIKLSVIPKIPALHIIAKNGEEYYMDRRGSTMPTGNITGNLCIATGNITKKMAHDKLAGLARCIQDSAFWNANVQQIEVKSETDVRLYTRIADHVIQLGDPTYNLTDKLWRLRVFYAKGLPVAGWNKYKAISVEYDNIVIGRTNEYDKMVETKSEEEVDDEEIIEIAEETDSAEESKTADQKPNSQKTEEKKTESPKAEQKKTETPKAEQKKAETPKVEQKKTETAKTEQKKG